MSQGKLDYVLFSLDDKIWKDHARIRQTVSTRFGQHIELAEVGQYLQTLIEMGLAQKRQRRATRKGLMRAKKTQDYPEFRRTSKGQQDASTRHGNINAAFYLPK